MNNRPVVKICGIKNPKILQCALSEGADLVGFMHFAKSPRHVEPNQIAQLIAKTGNTADTVVVLVDPDDSLVKQIGALKPDFIQLHGHETVERVQAIREISGTKIIKVLPVATAGDLSDIGTYNGVADRILLDAKPPKGATRPGGLGTTFDWSLLNSLNPDIEFMLSGGLTPDNVAGAILRVNPMGVDVSSGVETRPGEKDMDLIKAFIHNARAAVKENI